ncbi:RHS repeat domain-containing protein [Granulicella sibirica]|nr:RHS repeat domain-containing protein [Granulicella sibirica]
MGGIVIAFGIGASGYRMMNHGSSSRPRPWSHGGAVALPSELSGTGRIYLLQLGSHKDPYAVVEMASWLRGTYSLDTQVLPPEPLSDATYDHSRHSYVAERINDQIKRDHPGLAADPNAVLIGFTDDKMYSVTERYSDTFSQRDHRTAIISSEGMQYKTWFGRGANWKTPTSVLLQNRLRRILLKDVAVLFWHLPLNDDPGSLLYYRLNPNLPGNDVFESDLDPVHSPWGLYVADPCIVFTHSPESSLTITNPLIQQCDYAESAGSLQSALATPDHPPDTSEERIELRLANGLLTEKHTDFFLPGAIPIRLERATSSRWQMASAFGMSGSHNYDRYLGSFDGMRHMVIASAGSSDVGLTRHPSWLPLLLLNTWVDSDLSGSALKLRWVASPAEHFDLTRYNGEVDSYLPCTDVEVCYLNAYEDATGQKLIFERDSQRNLLSLRASSGSWVRLTHDSNPEVKIRVTEISDSQGRKVKYAYNQRGQLSEAAYPSGEVLSYEYDGAQNLLSVASSLGGGPKLPLITNRYERGHLVAQTLTDGHTYRYAFLEVSNGVIARAQVTAPDGTLFQIAFGRDGAAIHADEQGSEHSLTKVARTSFGALPQTEVTTPLIRM